MTLLEPGVFWSDIALGVLVLGLGRWLLRDGNRWWKPFGTLALATWTGAFYHGFVNTTERLSGELLWTATLLLLAATAALFLDEVLGGHLAGRLVIGLGWLAYAVFAITVSEEFLWALALQGLAIAAIGAWYVVARSRRWEPARFARVGLIYVAFVVVTGVAIVIQQAKITLGIDWSHNTLFHLVQMPAMVLLAVFLGRAR